MSINVNDTGRVMISSVVVGGFFVILYIYLTRKLTGAPDNDILSILLGALASNFTSVVSFWIGSSSGSAAKDDAIKEITQTSNANSANMAKAAVDAASASVVAASVVAGSGNGKH